MNKEVGGGNAYIYGGSEESYSVIPNSNYSLVVSTKNKSNALVCVLILTHLFYWSFISKWFSIFPYSVILIISSHLFNSEVSGTLHTILQPSCKVNTTAAMQGKQATSSHGQEEAQPAFNLLPPDSKAVLFPP